MALNPIGKPTMTADQIHLISEAATTLATVDHYLKHGTVPDRKLANECRLQCKALEAEIESERTKRRVQEDTTFASDVPT